MHHLAGARYPRVRSVAANCYMNGADENFEWSYRFLPYCIFRKTTDIITPSPSRAFVVIDEHEDYIVGSAFWVDCYDLDAGKASWQSFPTSRHSGSATLSFADGHAEIKRWLDSKTKQPVKGNSVSIIPLEENSDARWLAERSSSRNPNFTLQPPPP